jgi:hypothetical protein
MINRWRLARRIAGGGGRFARAADARTRTHNGVMKKPSARPANSVIGAGVRDLLAREFEEQEFTPSYSQWLTPQPAEPLPPAPQPFRPPPPP